jgi:ABC-type multidrug transport system fused ATPase/permease subunit
MDNYEKGARFVKKDGSIVFNKVSFAYFTDEALSLKDLETSKDGQTEEVSTEEEKDTENKNIFTDFHLEIKGGQKVAIVGKSGSGKTTLAKLVTGLLHPKQGQVFVDGQNMRSVSLKSYYKYVGYLTQEPSVFDGTIKENLLYAVDKKDLEKVNNMVIEEALRKAHCDFVLNMKKGLNTEIGEKGIRLSGGERQRLAIAKLFLKNPEIIILDEPTSALDSFSEDLITQSLEELFKGRTVIIIAHRLQTVKKADRILVLDSGRIVEDGDHESLVDKGGIYSKMLAMQSGF